MPRPSPQVPPEKASTSSSMASATCSGERSDQRPQCLRQRSGRRTRARAALPWPRRCRGREGAPANAVSAFPPHVRGKTPGGAEVAFKNVTVPPSERSRHWGGAPRARSGFPWPGSTPQEEGDEAGNPPLSRRSLVRRSTSRDAESRARKVNHVLHQGGNARAASTPCRRRLLEHHETVALTRNTSRNHLPPEAFGRER